MLFSVSRRPRSNGTRGHYFISYQPRTRHQRGSPFNMDVDTLWASEHCRGAPKFHPSQKRRPRLWTLCTSQVKSTASTRSSRRGTSSTSITWPSSTRGTASKTAQSNSEFPPPFISVCRIAVRKVDQFDRRHLLRFWLRDPENAWHTPKILEQRWAQIYGGVTSENEVFPVEPFIRSAGNKGR